MADDDRDQEKTEQATPRRREEARKKGQVARSQEIASVTVLLACITYFYFDSARLTKKMADIISGFLRGSGKLLINTDNIQTLTIGWVYEFFILIAPLLMIVLIAGILANFIQVGFVFSAEALEPKFSKIDPVKGFQRLFSLKSFAELTKSIVKLCIVSYVAYVTVKGEIDVLPSLMDRSIGDIMVYMGEISFKIILRTSWVLIVLAVLDYVYQRWEYEKGLRMSRQEIKDEYKQTEGDPLMKARIRRIQREMARKRMMAKVPKADVVITNPDHIAVALEYDQLKMFAPVVVAKGVGFVAEKIKEIARQNNVPIVENKPLAQVLNKMVKVDEVIPENLYKAVAEILAYVYGLKEKRVAV
ncbi:MAG TPA: flagellar biosynthesis protein FlhB [Syntrophales bacterium]|nr:flagellar biosynthesis protein FlhB [Syntrophales bacterium]